MKKKTNNHVYSGIIMTFQLKKIEKMRKKMFSPNYCPLNSKYFLTFFIECEPHIKTAVMS